MPSSDSEDNAHNVEKRYTKSRVAKISQHSKTLYLTLALRPNRPRPIPTKRRTYKHRQTIDNHPNACSYSAAQCCPRHSVVRDAHHHLLQQIHRLLAWSSKLTSCQRSVPTYKSVAALILSQATRPSPNFSAARFEINNRISKSPYCLIDTIARYATDAETIPWLVVGCVLRPFHRAHHTDVHSLQRIPD